MDNATRIKVTAKVKQIMTVIKRNVPKRELDLTPEDNLALAVIGQAYRDLHDRDLQRSTMLEIMGGGIDLFCESLGFDREYFYSVLEQSGFKTKSRLVA